MTKSMAAAMVEGVESTEYYKKYTSNAKKKTPPSATSTKVDPHVLLRDSPSVLDVGDELTDEQSLLRRRCSFDHCVGDESLVSLPYYSRFPLLVSARTLHLLRLR